MRFTIFTALTPPSANEEQTPRNNLGFFDLGDEEALIGTGTRSSQDECSTGDQTIILGLQIFLDHISSSAKDQYHGTTWDFYDFGGGGGTH